MALPLREFQRLATQLRQIIAGLQVEHTENRTHRTSPWLSD
jgi:hypothetical protein